MRALRRSLLILGGMEFLRCIALCQRFIVLSRQKSEPMAALIVQLARLLLISNIKQNMGK